jgi:hypothetical protein
MGVDHAPYLTHLSDFDHREQIKRGNCRMAVRQVAQNKLGNDKRMDGNVVVLNLPVEFGVSFSKVIDPYRSICKDHFAFARLRGM